MTGSFLLYIGGGSIESAQDTMDQSAFVWDMFKEWVLIKPPDHFELMNSVGSLFIDPASIALWEQYTDVVTASPEAANQFFMEQEARAEYVGQAHAICEAATVRFRAAEAELGLDQGYSGLEDTAAGYAALVLIWEEALAEMRALPPPPEAARGLFSVFYSLADQQTDVYRQITAAASAGDTARVEMLGTVQLDLAHQMDGLPDRLQRCPVYLPGG